VLITKQPFRADHRTLVVEKRLNGLHEVIQAADIVVNHGGAGIVMEALLSGKPMLCVPFAYDQFNNASCISRILSAGMSVDAQKATSVATVRRTLRDIDDKGCHGHAQKHKETLLSKGRASLHDVLKATKLRHEGVFSRLMESEHQGPAREIRSGTEE
jgi:UDP-N-acetylglucosamine:LPS N-acetylglucosamine transferase